MKDSKNISNPPEHVKKKMLLFFINKSLPRILEEERYVYKVK